MLKILDRLRSFESLGSKLLDDGTLLIGKAPHIAPQAWLHLIYPALTDKMLEEIEIQVNSPLSNDYKSFLKVTNGLKIFNTTFYLYGLRMNYKRSVEAAWQPFDIVTPNTLERPKNAQPKMLFIGGYDWDGSNLYIDITTDKIHLCDRYDATSNKEWPNFSIILENEISRLISLFDEYGQEIDLSRSTLP